MRLPDALIAAANGSTLHDREDLEIAAAWHLEKYILATANHRGITPADAEEALGLGHTSDCHIYRIRTRRRTQP